MRPLDQKEGASSPHYNFRFIETKWQEQWDEQRAFVAKEQEERPKKYILDMFPYPSGAGLHVGHIMNYAATDILSRYWRMKGYNVLHPMGWDSFGLPAEQFAIRTKTHPRETTARNIERYRAQLKAVGLSYDWEREVATSDPSYFKWTQWIFTKLYERGLAYEAEAMVNYCPELRAVLANEEVCQGVSVEGGYGVIQKPLKQWVLKITAYAERLLEDLEELDWPEHLKRQQRHWIGKSVGATVTFKVNVALKVKELSLAPFTTRPDTLLGVTFLAIAPEHPQLDQLVTSSHQREAKAYCEEASRKSLFMRTELNKEKTGVFTGTSAICPLTGRDLPIYIADYVIASYGSGCVMGVPAHDARDYEFAKKYQLPIQATILSETLFEEAKTPSFDESLLKEDLKEVQLERGLLYAPNYPELHGLCSEVAGEKIIELLEQQGLAQKEVRYKLRDWLFSRQRYWGEPIPIMHLKEGGQRALRLDELPLLPPEIEDYKPAEDGQSPLAKVSSWVEQEEGRRETNTMPQWAGSCWYYLRFCDPKNEGEAWSVAKENYWMPVDIYVGGVEHAVLHLLYARFWHKVLFDLGLVSTKEPFQTLKNQGMMVARAYKKEKGGYVEPHQVVRKEEGLFCPQGERVSEVIEKMSKSKLNGVSPEEITTQYGADALRLYAMFMGPFDKEKLWSTESVGGCYRLLKRIWNLFEDKGLSRSSQEGLAQTHLCLQGVEQDLLAWQFNTAIAKMMEWINDVTRLESFSYEAGALFLKLLYPFAPHIACELWQRHYQGAKESEEYSGPLWEQNYPQVEERWLQELQSDRIEMVGQINGKVRARLQFTKEASKEELFAAFLTLEPLQKYLLAPYDPKLDWETNQQATGIQKAIFIPGKLVNFVVKK